MSGRCVGSSELAAFFLRGYHLRLFSRVEIMVDITVISTRGWPNQSMCPLCRCAPETAVHLMVHCRFSVRIWDAIFEWLSVDIQTQGNWQSFSTVFDWWTAVATTQGTPLKALCLVLILVSWEIWKERNARVFQSNYSTVVAVVNKIKECRACAWRALSA